MMNSPLMNSDDTIAAISTAQSEAGIGIIRVSGHRSIAASDNIFIPSDGRGSLVESPSHIMHYGFISSEGEIVDEVLVCVMRAPRTFTAEDTVEINCHGGLLALHKVLEAVLKQGVRLAEPGEFTKRAFLNGRIDLTKAEAVMDVIRSESDLALRNSMRQLRGSVFQSVNILRSEIIHEIARIEAALDDPENYDLDDFSSFSDNFSSLSEHEKSDYYQFHENTEFHYVHWLDYKTLKWIESLRKLSDTASTGRMIREGIRVVITGKPNAGKSSLLNALLRQERAIVTNYPGTTRDILTESLCIGSLVLTLADTAGIRDTEDYIEKIGVEKATEAVGDADLVLYLVDSSEDLDENDRKILDLAKDKKCLILLNKTDLEPKVSLEEVEKWCMPHPVLAISAMTGNGIADLEKAIEEIFKVDEQFQENGAIITNVRHLTLLESCIDSLDKVRRGIEAGMTEDFLAIDLTDAAAFLGEITGDQIRDDLVEEIFSKFCMGK